MSLEEIAAYPKDLCLYWMMESTCTKNSILYQSRFTWNWVTFCGSITGNEGSVVASGCLLSQRVGLKMEWSGV
jgi:hypothetical protein